jgi:hypothetical protein
MMVKVGLYFWWSWFEFRDEICLEPGDTESGSSCVKETSVVSCVSETNLLVIKFLFLPNFNLGVDEYGSVRIL